MSVQSSNVVGAFGHVFLTKEVVDIAHDHASRHSCVYPTMGPTIKEFAIRSCRVPLFPLFMRVDSALRACLLDRSVCSVRNELSTFGLKQLLDSLLAREVTKTPRIVLGIGVEVAFIDMTMAELIASHAFVSGELGCPDFLKQLRLRHVVKLFACLGFAAALFGWHTDQTGALCATSTKRRA